MTGNTSADETRTRQALRGYGTHPVRRLHYQYWSPRSHASDTGFMPSRADWFRPGGSSGERRNGNRFPLGMGLQYTVLSSPAPRITGEGRVVDVSRSGVRFTADRAMVSGMNIELAIQWPVLLDGDVQMQLVLSGNIVWADGNEAAMEIVRHEFRTRGGRLKVV